jgi:hypothetical protein
VEIQFRVATLNDIDRAFAFSEERFDQNLSEMERMLAMWKVRWRKEAITHYFNTGWSFIAELDGKFAGYFMAQPFIHFRGQTQTVWVEHLESENEKVAQSLIEIAVKVAREKHMQRVLFSGELESALKIWNPNLVNEKVLEVKTTKG